MIKGMQSSGGALWVSVHLGICGIGGVLALLAWDLEYKVSGSDANVIQFNNN